MRGDIHGGFGYEKLVLMLRKRTGWVLSYNDHPDIRKWYHGLGQCGRSDGKTSGELLVLNVWTVTDE